jgi:predicted glycoside hydrolase/deacetylase ChbG (UPF0249 family)
VTTRTLIVNGDDFGLTSGVNAGILEAHERGILTSASVFAHAAATDDALAIARRTPTLGIGCHLTLVDGTPLSPPSTVPTLAPDGVLRPTWRAFIAAALAGRLALGDVEHELIAQIDRVRSAGIRVTHLDAHKHVHAFPPVFEVVARLARRFGIGAVRVPWERPALTLALRSAVTRGARRQAVENLAMTYWARRDSRLLARYGLAPAPRFFGRVLTGLFTPATFHALLASVPEGTSELMLHPGYPDAALDRVRTRLRTERATELALLTDPSTLDTVRRAGLTLARHGRAPILREPHTHVS